MPITPPTFVEPNAVTGAIQTLDNTLNALLNTSAAIVTKTDTATATLTAANMIAARDTVYINMTGSTAGSTLTMDVVSNLVPALQAALPGVNVVGMAWVIRVINTGGGNTWTVTTATGWTLTGTMTVANNTWRDFILTINSLTAATLQSVGVGTQS